MNPCQDFESERITAFDVVSIRELGLYTFKITSRMTDCLQTKIYKIRFITM
jgi:hypothetical protein